MHPPDQCHLRRLPHGPLVPCTAALATLLLCGCEGALGGDEAPVVFVDGTAAAGIDFVHENGRSEEMYFIESLPAGAIFFDAEDDGDPDLYLLNGTFVARAAPDPPPTNAFYVNDGTGRFDERTAGSGLADPRFSIGVAGADVENDGDVDLYVTTFEEPNALFRSEGGLRFEDVARSAGVEGRYSFDSSPAFADLDADGFVDLYVPTYNNHTVEHNLTCFFPNKDGSGPGRRYCTVHRYEPVPDLLYRGRGDGTFEDVSEASGVGAAAGRSFGVAFGDYDEDGDQDILVACDMTPTLYFENLGGMRFREIGAQSGLAFDKNGKLRGGMGVASGDLDGDGDLDAAITFFQKEANGFYEQHEANVFTGIEAQNGTAASSVPYVGWGIEFFDADLDTDLDCLLTNGHYIDNAHWFSDHSAGYAQPNLFYLNRGGGRFASLREGAGPALSLVKVSRGLAVADVDGDGDLDALVANLHDRPDLLRNETPRAGRHWLIVRLIGTRSNRDGIGARIVARLPGLELVREVRTAQSIFSQSDMRAHFGLGPHARVPRLEVLWPSGAVTELEDVAADRVLVIVEGEDAPRTVGALRDGGASLAVSPAASSTYSAASEKTPRSTNSSR